MTSSVAQKLSDSSASAREDLVRFIALGDLTSGSWALLQTANSSEAGQFDAE
jgi:hypothetical protein